jgi:UDP-GlcNAc:undecaprenyl-phosphate GlcNAc-1-phosphate transferase
MVINAFYKQILFLFFISGGISYILTPLIRKISLRFNYLDNPDKRKIHLKPTPTIGGISLFIAFNITVLLAMKLNSIFWAEFLMFLPGLLLGGILIVILGMIHDIKNISAWSKLAGQIIVAVVLFLNGNRIESITNPFGGQISLPLIFSLILTIIWIISLINTINLIDGLDGLAAGLTAISAFSLFFIAVFRGDISAIFLTIILIGSILGFLRYNFHPAKIFMGDTGSMFLGFVLSIISIHGINKMATVVALIIPLIAFGIPIYDTFVAIVRRIVMKQHVFRADRQHIHYRLLNLGITHRHVVLLLYFMGIYFGIIAYLFVLIPVEFGFILLVLIAMGVFAGEKAIGFIEYRTKELIKARRVNK